MSSLLLDKWSSLPCTSEGSLLFIDWDTSSLRTHWGKPRWFHDLVTEDNLELGVRPKVLPRIVVGCVKVVQNKKNKTLSSSPVDLG